MEQDVTVLRSASHECQRHTRECWIRPSTKHRSPLAKNDHPELNTSDLLDEDGIARYQSLIGILQWTITLGRFDVGTAVMTMSGFRVAPREGHMDRLRRICGYLVRFSEGCIRIRMDKPDTRDHQIMIKIGPGRSTGT